jgi:hypothetical protein
VSPNSPQCGRGPDEPDRSQTYASTLAFDSVRNAAREAPGAIDEIAIVTTLRTKHNISRQLAR